MDDSANTVNVGLGTVADNTYNYMNNLLSNPSLIIILVIVIIIYVIIFLSLGSSNVNSNELTEDVSNSSSNIIYIILIAFFIVLIIINGFQYFFGFDIVAKLKNLFSGSPEVDINVINTIPKTPVPEIVLKPQVFNIPGNDYIYSDAKALCTAYGSRLATYKEIEDSYKNGGEWCNYGWSEGQMALYPTQEETYNNLQKIKGHENDCGRPGINGGYIANPKIKFGVNCFGFKPRMNSTEEELMATEPVYPKTLKDIEMENRVNYWKDRLTEILVSPFNHDTWSKL
jgi:hypothetical protein